MVQFKKEQIIRLVLIATIIIMNVAIVFNYTIVKVGAASNKQVSNSVVKKDYYDINGHWAESNFLTLISKGIFKGDKSGKLIVAQPEKVISRGEFITLLMQSFDLKINEKKLTHYKDIPKGSKYEPLINKVTSNSLISGYSDNSFKPGQTITNLQISIAITRLKNLQYPDKNSLKKGDDLNWYNQNVINNLKVNLKKVPVNKFIPNNGATRAEVVAVLSRYIDIIQKEYKNSNSKPTPKPTLKPKVTPTPKPTIKVRIAPITQIDTKLTKTPTPVPVPADTAPGLSGYKINAKAGDIVYFQVFAFALVDLGKFDFKISYDPLKVIASSVRSGVIKDSDYIGKTGNVDLNEASKGIVFIKSDDTSKIRQTNGTIFTIVFRVLPGVSGAADIKMSCSDNSMPKLYDTKGKVIPNITSSNGSIIIKK